MDTIEKLERKLKQAKKQTTANQAKFPTGIIIDLQAPEGNAIAILALCRHLFTDFGIISEYDDFQKQCLNGNYKNLLSLAHSWFGFIYLNGENEDD